MSNIKDLVLNDSISSSRPFNSPHHYENYQAAIHPSALNQEDTSSIPRGPTISSARKLVYSHESKYSPEMPIVKGSRIDFNDCKSSSRDADYTSETRAYKRANLHENFPETYNGNSIKTLSNHLYHNHISDPADGRRFMKDSTPASWPYDKSSRQGAAPLSNGSSARSGPSYSEADVNSVGNNDDIVDEQVGSTFRTSNHYNHRKSISNDIVPNRSPLPRISSYVNDSSPYQHHYPASPNRSVSKSGSYQSLAHQERAYYYNSRSDLTYSAKRAYVDDKQNESFGFEKKPLGHPYTNHILSLPNSSSPQSPPFRYPQTTQRTTSYSQSHYASPQTHANSGGLSQKPNSSDNSKLASSPQLKDSNSSSAVDKHERRLQRNRIAAKECRLRKKNYIFGLESRINELQKTNASLLSRINDLEEQIAQK
ncbi:Cyclic AMP-responsive element-binding protein 1 [Smittium mucronatum]|uniref:Cyclic AMP-responsive element-binding protein 1 n=1 Tax=Smittium mucronatum TaxID=133383 RepID=A0A1R0H6Z5_9FUNG|nr:Cyclic AMP-responsive element-binding protein 1 [Smittium mucronatum]